MVGIARMGRAYARRSVVVTGGNHECFEAKRVIRRLCHAAVVRVHAGEPISSRGTPIVAA